MTDTNPLDLRFYPRYPRLVCVESAYAGDVRANKAFLRRALLDSLSRGEAPYASHAYLPDVLDDGDASQRSIGLQAGHAWAKMAACIAIYLRDPAERISRGVVERLAAVAPAQDMTPIVIRVAEEGGFREFLVVERHCDLDGCLLVCEFDERRPADPDNCYRLFYSVGMGQEEVFRRYALTSTRSTPALLQPAPRPASWTLAEVLQWAREDCFNDDGRSHVDSTIKELERIVGESAQDGARTIYRAELD